MSEAMKIETVTPTETPRIVRTVCIPPDLK
jgi:hypothetical protein